MANLRVNGTNPFNSVPSPSAPSSRPIIPSDAPRRSEPVRDNFSSDSRRGNIPSNSVQFGSNPFNNSPSSDFSKPVIPNDRPSDRPYGQDPFNKPHQPKPPVYNDRPYGHDPFDKPNYPQPPHNDRPWGHDPFDKPNYPVLPKPPVFPDRPWGQDPFDQDPFNSDPYGSGNWEERQAYDRLLSAESNSVDARRNLEVIRNARRPGETLSEVTDSFIQVLRAEGGGAYTSDARSSFEMIQNSLRRGESRSNATDT